MPRQRLWRIRAREIVLATGSIERPLVYADNDRPGCMLASAARTYVNRYGATPGKRAIVMTNNDSAYQTALDLEAAGVVIAAVIDLRSEATGELAQAARARGIEVLAGQPCESSASSRSGGRRQCTGVRWRRVVRADGRTLSATWCSPRAAGSRPCIFILRRVRRSSGEGDRRLCSRPRVSSAQPLGRGRAWPVRLGDCLTTGTGPAR
jgi:hypothetical protein